MGLLRKHNLLFVHITKTGGNSVHEVMESAGKLEFYNEHYTINSLRDKINDDGLFNRLTKFAIVRNPWDRMLSIYLFRFYDPKIGSIKTNFNKWIEFIYSGKKQRLMHHSLLLHKYEYSNQLNWITGDDGDIWVNDILRFENIENDMVRFLRFHGIRIKEFPKTNFTEHNHYWHYYDAKSIGLVADHYEKDLQFFNYHYKNDS